MAKRYKKKRHYMDYCKFLYHLFQTWFAEREQRAFKTSDLLATFTRIYVMLFNEFMVLLIS